MTLVTSVHPVGLMKWLGSVLYIQLFPVACLFADDSIVATLSDTHTSSPGLTVYLQSHTELKDI